MTPYQCPTLFHSGTEKEDNSEQQETSRLPIGRKWATELYKAKKKMNQILYSKQTWIDLRDTMLIGKIASCRITWKV